MSALSRARKANLLIRDVRAQPGLGRALRISIGTPEQNDRLVQALHEAQPASRFCSSIGTAR